MKRKEDGITNRKLIPNTNPTQVNVGHYAGMIEMATAVGQGLGVPVFARLSDKYGRRPVTLIGVFVACLTSCMFGFARSFPLLLVLRAMVGIANAASAA